MGRLTRHHMISGSAHGEVDYDSSVYSDVDADLDNQHVDISSLSQKRQTGIAASIRKGIGAVVLLGASLVGGEQKAHAEDPPQPQMSAPSGSAFLSDEDLLAGASPELRARILRRQGLAAQGVKEGIGIPAGSTQELRQQLGQQQQYHVLSPEQQNNNPLLVLPSVIPPNGYLPRTLELSATCKLQARSGGFLEYYANLARDIGDQMSVGYDGSVSVFRNGTWEKLNPRFYTTSVEVSKEQRNPFMKYRLMGRDLRGISGIRFDTNSHYLEPQYGVTPQQFQRHQQFFPFMQSLAQKFVGQGADCKHRALAAANVSPQAGYQSMPIEGYSNNKGSQLGHFVNLATRVHPQTGEGYHSLYDPSCGEIPPRLFVATGAGIANTVGRKNMPNGSNYGAYTKSGLEFLPTRPIAQIKALQANDPTIAALIQALIAERNAVYGAGPNQVAAN